MSLRRNAMFYLAAGVITLVIALLVSPFASAAPDGLDGARGRLGLVETPASPPALLADYETPGIQNAFWSRGLAGLLGAAAVFLITTALVKSLARRAPSTESAPAIPALNRPTNP